jgi:hypothetical protein
MNELLNKYFEGETSSAEELQLRQYFRSAEVADEHKAYKPLFVYIDEEIDAQEKLTKRHIAFPKRTMFYYISAVACCALILLSISLFNANQQNEFPCLADGSYAIINGVYISDAKLIKSLAFQALAEVSIPVENYFPEKETADLKEIMRGQLRELGNIFNEQGIF